MARGASRRRHRRFRTFRYRREVVTVFVPPNDARTTKDPAKSIRVIPELRQEPAREHFLR